MFGAFPCSGGWAALAEGSTLSTSSSSISWSFCVTEEGEVARPGEMEGLGGDERALASLVVEKAGEGGLHSVCKRALPRLRRDSTAVVVQIGRAHV